MNAVTLSQYAESVPIECSVERAALSASVIRVFCVGVVVMKRARRLRCCWREVEVEEGGESAKADEMLWVSTPRTQGPTDWWCTPGQWPPPGA